MSNHFLLSKQESILECTFFSKPIKDGEEKSEASDVLWVLSLLVSIFKSIGTCDNGETDSEKLQCLRLRSLISQL